MAAILKKAVNRGRLMFQWRYFRGQTPWDTEVTPPEVIEFMENTPPGKALDLGCGTGTNAITLALRGWEVTGVDFVGKAIRTARKKAAKAGLDIEFHVADVTDLSFLNGTYDYVLDIGCLFTLEGEDRIRYARNLKRLMKPNGVFMLYAWLPRPRKKTTWGIAPEEVDALLKPDFIEIRTAIGEEKGFPTGWYWYRKK
ncbi:MAG: class I SAM-dependent methyltransferase [Desulfobacterales bacterium]